MSAITEEEVMNVVHQLIADGKIVSLNKVREILQHGSYSSIKKFLIKNTIFSCIIGTISAICMPFIIQYSLLLFIYKILTAMLMILVLKKYKTYRKYFLYLLVFFVYNNIVFEIANILLLDTTSSNLIVSIADKLANALLPFGIFARFMVVDRIVNSILVIILVIKIFFDLKSSGAFSPRSPKQPKQYKPRSVNTARVSDDTKENRYNRDEGSK